jgi:S1-C subfamily serine protease
VYSTETKEGIIVQGVSESGPSAEAGVEPGDVIRAVAGETVDDLGEFYRIVWQRGRAGVDVPLTLVRDGKLKQVTVQSIDRNALLKKPSLQ